MQSQVAVKRLKNEYLERSTVIRIATEIVKILSKTCENKFSGWEWAREQAADEIGAAIAAATNETTHKLENKHNE